MANLFVLIIFGTLASWFITTLLYYVRTAHAINHLWVGVSYAGAILVSEALANILSLPLPLTVQLVLTNLLVSWMVITLAASVFSWIVFEHTTARRWTTVLFFTLTVSALFICY